MPQNNQTLLEKTVADQWQTLPSGLTVIVRPMPGYSSTHVIFATRFGSIDRDFRLDGKEVHLPAAWHTSSSTRCLKIRTRCLCKVCQDRCQCQRIYQL